MTSLAESHNDGRAGTTLSFAGYWFDPYDRIWPLDHYENLNWSWADELLAADLIEPFREVLKFYAEAFSSGHCVGLAYATRRYALFLERNGKSLNSFRAADLISYRATLDRRRVHYLGKLRTSLYKWHELNLPGIEVGVISLLEGWRIPGVVKGEAVRNRCPKTGPLTPFEYEGLKLALVESFERDEIDLEDYVCLELLIATGRRPKQLTDLKSCDLIEECASDGLKAYVLNIPRAKQRGKRWREEFKPFALTPELGAAVRALTRRNYYRFKRCCGQANDSDQLPLFVDWRQVERTASLYETIDEILVETLGGKTIQVNTLALNSRLDKVLEKLAVHSERTGKSLRVTPQRLRRTLGTRAAVEGYGDLVIAELLDHSDTQNASVYIANIPEHVNAINRAVAEQLAPLAQAFAGILVRDENEAKRGNDPTSRIRSEDGRAGMGTCGHYGFCGALAPIACYTCQHFQPWVDGPHTEVLETLIERREEIKVKTGDMTMASINDRTIMAITQVVQMCRERAQQLTMRVTDER